jgi:hypothetical protein
MTTHSYTSKNKNGPSRLRHSSAAGHNNLNAFMDAVFNMSSSENKLMILNVIEKLYDGSYISFCYSSLLS